MLDIQENERKQDIKQDMCSDQDMYMRMKIGKAIMTALRKYYYDRVDDFLSHKF